MLTDVAQFKWAQTGWVEHPNPVIGRADLIQYHSPEGINTIFILNNLPVGSPRDYSAEYIPESGVTPAAFSFIINGSSAHSDDAGFSPTGAQQFGEIQSLADQMPGGTQSNEVFNNSQVRFLNGGWEDFAGAPANDSGHFGITKWTQARLHIWDRACAT